MKLQTTRTGNSYLLLIEQMSELTELPQWLTCLNKPAIIVVPKKLMSLTTHVQNARDDQQERDKGGSLALVRRSELDEHNTEPLDKVSRHHVITLLTLVPSRRRFALSQLGLSPLAVALVILTLLAVVCAGLGLLLLHLGSPLAPPPTGVATLHSDLISWNRGG
jgi:hypothetical protein